MKKVFFMICVVMFCSALIQTANAQHANPGKTGKVLTMGPVEIVYPGVELTVFPNPASSQVEIGLTGTLHKAGKEGFALELRDEQGHTLLQQKWNGEKIDVSEFPTGVYILTLKRKQEVYSQKLVVNR